MVDDVWKRVPFGVRSPEVRIKDFEEVVIGYDRETAIEEAKRCLRCKKPKCMEACPIHQDIPEYIHKIAEGDFDGALRTILEINPLPGVCGRVCISKCETECVRGKKGDAIAIHLLKRAASDFGDAEFEPPDSSTGKKVAVIGSGPAGLTTALVLRLRGHDVKIFEQKSVSGGMLSLCIPTFRLPKEVVKKDIDRILSTGVELELNVRIGEDIKFKELLKEYDAIFIGVGALKPKRMNIDGEDAEGIIHVIPFLEGVYVHNKKYSSKKTVVVGGGYSAIDAVRTAKRLGSEALIVYRRMREQMPASQTEVYEAEEEGVKLHLLTNPKRVVVKDGKMVGIECIKMKLGDPDTSGRPRPIPIEGSEFTMDADMMIQAISQEPDLSFIGSEEFKITKWNTFEINEMYSTSKKGVWAAGDAATGPLTIADAMCGARKAAEDMHIYLTNRV